MENQHAKNTMLEHNENIKNAEIEISNADNLPIKITEKTCAEFFRSGGLDPIFEAAKEKYTKDVFDVSTKKARAELSAHSNKIRSERIEVDRIGRLYLKKIKALPKEVELELRVFIKKMDDLRNEVRRPLDEWTKKEEEKKRIAAELKAAKEMEEKKNDAWEIAILLNEKFDRDRKDAEAEKERQRLENEERLKQEAIQKAQEEIELSKQREIESREREKESRERAKKAELEAQELQKKREEQEKINRENELKIKAQEEENERLRQEKIKLDRAANIEKAKKEAEELAKLEKERQLKNVEYIRGLLTEAKTDLIENAGLDNDQAVKVVLAIKNSLVRNVQITI